MLQTTIAGVMSSAKKIDPTLWNPGGGTVNLDDLIIVVGTQYIVTKLQINAFSIPRKFIDCKITGLKPPRSYLKKTYLISLPEKVHGNRFVVRTCSFF